MTEDKLATTLDLNHRAGECRSMNHFMQIFDFHERRVGSLWWNFTLEQKISIWLRWVSNQQAELQIKSPNFIFDLWQRVECRDKQTIFFILILPKAFCCKLKTSIWSNKFRFNRMLTSVLPNKFQFPSTSQKFCNFNNEFQFANRSNSLKFKWNQHVLLPSGWRRNCLEILRSSIR